MKRLRNLFRRKPKGYRFPNGIPRVEIPPPVMGSQKLDVCFFPDGDGWMLIGRMPSGAPVYVRPTEGG